MAARSFTSLVATSFNQDASHFTVATDSGFRILTTNPSKEIIKREFTNDGEKREESIKKSTASHRISLDPTVAASSEVNGVERRKSDAVSPIMGEGGFGIVEMLNKTNILALVGGGLLPKFPTNRVVIVTCDKITVFTLSAQPQKLFSFDTADNTKGLVAFSTAVQASTATLAFPSKTPGQLYVAEIPLGQPQINLATSKVQTPSLSIIPAHNSKITIIAVSEDGTLIATASVKGTLVRVFHAASKKKLSEFRRGADEAEIYSLAFNRKNTRVVVASNKGTIHVFNLTPPAVEEKQMGEESNKLDIEKSTSQKHDKNKRTPQTEHHDEPKDAGNRHSALAFMSNVSTYFASEWSFAFARLPVETRCVCVFAEEADPLIPRTSTKEGVLVVGSDGSFYSFVFDSTSGGEMEMDRFNWYY